MSIIIHSSLSSSKTLQSKWKSRVLAMSETEMLQLRSQKGSSRRVRLAVVNLMPNKEETEEQWLNLFAQCEQWVEVRWFRTTSRQTVHCDADYLNRHYEAVENLHTEDFNAIVITGAPVEHLAFESVDYWSEIKDLLDRVRESQMPVLGVCWAAQAMMYYYHGINKYALNQKCFGLFEHRVNRLDLFKNLDRLVTLPQSRHTQWDEAAISNSGALEVLVQSEESGSFVVKDESNRWYFSGHLEYGPTTLMNEYERDSAKGVSIHVPSGYQQNENGLEQVGKPWEQSAVGIVEGWLNSHHQPNRKEVLACELA